MKGVACVTIVAISLLPMRFTCLHFAQFCCMLKKFVSIISSTIVKNEKWLASENTN